MGEVALYVCTNTHRKRGREGGRERERARERERDGPTSVPRLTGNLNMPFFLHREGRVRTGTTDV